ncbi:PEP-CTERM protein-sorting domain-containing protein [Verrucomicrobium sp. GAS474]|uniref:PEP-CTERM sorting domain-containing protein n=1 Tax=Verrucomicrobium sp. GAS474 TaxID=1882831 RepID=UPI00087BE1B4|nr:PEP-CTERM sorting domain-containing protein [Verrucomicrobium sp. GAS474]SDU30494.1 PEP-CTERM protein-sorting domain-containing protein [Verrucomicrobium sp. GAS474]
MKMGTRRALLSRFLFIALLAAAPLAAQAQSLVSLDFQGGITDFTNNFRNLSGTAIANSVTAQGASGSLALTLSNSYSANGAVVYDTTPADSTVQNTFSTSGGLDVHFQVTLSGTVPSSPPGIGVLFINPTGETSSLLALSNYVSDTSDRIRFFTGNPSGSNSGADFVKTDVSGNGGVSYTANTTTDVDVKYTVSGTSAILTMTIGTFTSTYNFGTGTALSNVEIGLRLFDQSSGNSVMIDNLTVSSIAAVPEPSTYALMILGAFLAGLAYRRKQGFTATAEVH